MIVFLLLSLFLFDLLPDVFLGRFLVLLIVCGVLFHFKRLSFSYTKWHEIVLFACVCFYLTFAIFGLPLFFRFDLFPPHWIGFSVSSIMIIFMLGFCWMAYVLLALLDGLKFLEGRKVVTDYFSSEKYRQKWLLLFGLMTALFMLWQRAFNPIIMSPDSYGYFIRDNIVIGRAVLFSFTNYLVTRLAPTSPAVEWIPVFWILVFSALFSTILMYFHMRWVRFKWVLIASAVLPLIPSIGLHAITLWPDMLNGMKMLWFTYVFFRVMDEIILSKTADKKQGMSLIVQFCVALTLLFFARANTTYVFYGIIPVLTVLFAFKKQWKLLITIPLSIVVVLLVRFPGYSAIGAFNWPHHDNHRFYAGLHDMQSVYFHGGNLSESTLGLLYEFIPNTGELRHEYTHGRVSWHLWHDLERISGLGTRDFIAAYADTFIRNPFAMMRTMLARNHHYWTINADRYIALVNYTAIYCNITGVYGVQAPDIYVYRNANFLTRGAYFYMQIMASRTPATFVWRYGFWTALMILSIAHLIFQKRYMWIIVYAPAFAYLVTLLLASGWSDYRYGLPIFLIGMFLPAASLCLNAQYVNKECGQNDIETDNNQHDGGQCNPHG